jgi:hypothetical protein
MPDTELFSPERIMIGIDAPAAIRLEVVDPIGQGFVCLLDADEALEMALGLVAAIARMKGYEVLS